MNKYGQVAINATKIIESRRAVTPLEAWNIATMELMGEGTWAQKKGCPKNAFLGLCEAGLVRGVPSGTYAAKSGEQKNKAYAIKAVELIKRTPALVNDKKALWDAVMDDKVMSHNYQMDVVLALWLSGSIHA
jgi:hypothetical protein